LAWWTALQAVQNIVQGFSGSLSDKLQKRKGIALAGYFTAALAKPLMGLSTWQGLRRTVAGLDWRGYAFPAAGRAHRVLSGRER